MRESKNMAADRGSLQGAFNRFRSAIGGQLQGPRDEYKCNVPGAHDGGMSWKGERGHKHEMKNEY